MDTIISIQAGEKPVMDSKQHTKLPELLAF
jgi:hypothetical protein